MGSNAPDAVTPNPSTLWYQANDEHPDDVAARTARYLELMRDAGHLIPRDELDDTPLMPCGWDPKMSAKLPDVPAPAAPALPLTSKPAEPPYCTCDWGGCDEDAVSWRWASGHGWLPVCAIHMGAPV